MKLHIISFSALLFSLCFQAYAQDLRSSSWEDLNASSQSNQSQYRGESVKVEFKLDLKGAVVDGEDRVTLEGKGKIDNSRLKMYFKRKKREFQQSDRSSYSRTSGVGITDASGFGAGQGQMETDGDGFDMGWSDEYMAGILDAKFKLLRLNPMVNTGNVTAEVYLGEEPFSPIVEALEKRIHPFKKTPMEIVMGSFYERDLRNVKVVVHIDAPISDDLKDKTFTAEFGGTWQIGDGFGWGMQPGGYDSGFNEDEAGDVQWVDEDEN